MFVPFSRRIQWLCIQKQEWKGHTKSLAHFPTIPSRMKEPREEGRGKRIERTERPHMFHGPALLFITSSE